MENKNLKYILYARRSIESSGKEEHIASTEDQIREMKEIAKRNNLNVVVILQETKTGSKTGVREEYNKMLQMIRCGKANAILTWKLNRIARNFLEGGEVVDLLQKGVIKEIRTYEKAYLPSDNVLMIAVELGMANQYSRDLAVDVKRGLYGAAERGYRPTFAPVGYLNSRYRQRGKDEEILVDEERFPLVRKMFELFLTGIYSCHKLMQIARDELGLTTIKSKFISKSNMYAILTNSFYCGEFEYPVGSGKWYKGNHKPMLTKEEFDKIQMILGSNGRPRPQTKEFAYTGLLKCATCGRNVTAERKVKRQKNGNVHSYTYYICTGKVNHTCATPSVTEKIIDSQIIKILENIEIPTAFHEWAMETLKEMHEHEKNNRNSILHEKQSEYKDVVRRLDVLLDLKLDGKIDDSNYERKKTELERRKSYLSDFMSDIDSRVDAWLKTAEEKFNLAETAKTKFETATLEEKRKILASLSQNRLIKDRDIVIQLEKPMLLIKEASEEVKKMIDIPEPPKPLQLKDIFDNSEKLCTHQDSNLERRFRRPL